MMNEEHFDKEKIINYWLESSDNDFSTMENLFHSKDYNWALFLGHLVIEKLLKALYVKKTENHALFSHDLLRLALKCNIELTTDQKDSLDTITTFNINTRYDNYKKSFYQLCSPDFTAQWLQTIKELRQWLKKKL